ncbi:hypothetical protein N8085_07030, partial [Salibacteraceae bacterium]|nr:hypothetical protein [Salibacteraceae bacterium]
MKLLFSIFCFFVFSTNAIFAQSEWKAGEVLVTLEQEVDVNYFLNELETNTGLQVNRVEALVPSANIYAFSFLNGQINVEEAVSLLKEQSMVKFAQPNHTNIEMRKSSNDPNAIGQWYLDKINAPLAWDITTGGST